MARMISELYNKRPHDPVPAHQGAPPAKVPRDEYEPSEGSTEVSADDSLMGELTQWHLEN